MTATGEAEQDKSVIESLEDEFDDLDVEEELKSSNEKSVEGEEQTVEDEAEPEAAYSTTIWGNNASRRRIAGSAHQVTEEQLERAEHDDVHRILKQVPGVYLRDEEGFGLRPNIGLRGANSDRSAKATLMEDGILLGPSPYSAPAAYYFPLVTRMTRIEVFKGPAAIQFGPQTVGGAINMKTRAIPFDGHRAGIDIAGGSYRAGKAHGHYGYGQKHFGALLEGVYLTHDGFKELDNDGPTGFQRADIMGKFRINTALDGEFVHRLDAKVGYAFEHSNETYLGLSDADFRANANRRYLSSARGEMDWSRTQLQLGYTFSWNNEVTFKATVYRHDLSRQWEKFNRFRNDQFTIADVLNNPDGGQTGLYHQILRGQQDSLLPDQALLIGTNDRRYVSQGLQLHGSGAFSFFGIGNEIEVGARIHNDQIERLHDEEGFLMTRGVLVPDGQGRSDIVSNVGGAWSGAAFIHDSISWGGLLITPGFRFELIRTSFENRLDGTKQDALRYAWLPGIGASYTIFDRATAFAGIHKGFSPVSPGQPQEILPEESINIESGLRYADGKFNIEGIGYFNRYANITGECTFSSGCDPTQILQQFNGGEAWVYGAELQGGYTVEAPLGLRLGANAAYTLSLSQFRTAFQSGFDQYGNVQVGDELPYVPVHQAGANFILGGRQWETSLDVSYVGVMRDKAGQGEIPPGEATDAQLVLDGGASFFLTEQVRIYFRADNIFNQRAIASRRPFGARPNKPRSFMLGLKVGFGG